MKADGALPKRKSLRLRGFDYTSPGAYFITMRIHPSAPRLGRIEAGLIRLTWAGEVVVRAWKAIGDHFLHAAPGEYCVMPDHFHALLYIVRARHAVPEQERMEAFGGPVSGSIPTIVRSFKSAVTREINLRRKTPGGPVWTRNYNEHVVRSEQALARIREYILHNPARLEIRRAESV